MNWAFWLELLIRSGVVLGAGEALRRLHARRSAAFRHRLLLVVFILLALLPAFSMLLPVVRIPLWLSESRRGGVTIRQNAVATAPVSYKHRTNSLLLIWVAGALAALAPACAGAFSFRRIAGRALRSDAAWEQMLDELSSNVPASRRPEILITSELAMPLTCGVFKPRILLPAAAHEWSVVRRRAVLLHELAHVQRRDVAAQLCVHLIAALWWFQPLVWVLRRSLRAESELASDSLALVSGLRPSLYAEELLSIAKAIRGAGRLSSVGIGMFRDGGLELRLQAILDHPSASISQSRIWSAFLCMAALAVGAATVTAKSQQNYDQTGGSIMKRTLLSGLLAAVGISAATISGSIYDPSGAAIPNASILLYNPDTGAKQEAVSGPDGRFALDGTPAGEYILRVEKPGFSSLFREFNLKADAKIERGLTMSVGPVDQRLRIQAKGKASESPQPREAAPLRVGGQISPANLIFKKPPAYPEPEKATGQQGTVEIEAVISKDGVPQEMRVLSSPNDDFSQAALDAVRQWRYRPTLLNGNPIDVVTSISIDFTLAQ